jgi:hypothetical protein
MAESEVRESSQAACNATVDLVMVRKPRRVNGTVVELSREVTSNAEMTMTGAMQD